jgi:hypothetical protein
VSHCAAPAHASAHGALADDGGLAAPRQRLERVRGVPQQRYAGERRKLAESVDRDADRLRIPAAGLGAADLRQAPETVPRVDAIEIRAGLADPTTGSVVLVARDHPIDSASRPKLPGGVVVVVDRARW